MYEKLKNRYDIASQTLSTLKNVLDKFESNTISKEYIMEIQDSVIRRFKYSIDTFWKFLKIYLQDHLKITLESTSPRTIIKKALTANLLSEQDSHILIDCIASYNKIPHAYNESLAQEVVNNIPEYYKIMHKILQNIPIIKT